MALRGTVAAAYLDDAAGPELLLARAEVHLGQGEWTEEEAPSVAAPHRAPDPEGIRETLSTAARERRPCAIHYVKAGADDGSVRVIHPAEALHISIRLVASLVLLEPTLRGADGGTDVYARLP